VLALGSAYAFTRAWQTRRAAWWAAAGALVAGLTLVRAVFVLALPLLVVAAVVRESPRGLRTPNAAAAIAAAALLLAPWLAWTAGVTGRPVLANYGEGFNLLVAAHGEGHGKPFEQVTADPAFVRDFERPHESFPSASRLRADPEAHPRYMREADESLRSAARAEYRSRLSDEPAQVGWEALYRAGFLWSAHHDWYQPERDALRIALAAVDWLLIGLAAWGLALALRSGGAARGVAVFLVAYTIILATHHVEARFAMPVRGLMLAFVVHALAQLPGAARRLGRS
jgi:hypothetical protein